MMPELTVPSVALVAADGNNTAALLTGTTDAAASRSSSPPGPSTSGSNTNRPPLLTTVNTCRTPTQDAAQRRPPGVSPGHSPPGVSSGGGSRTASPRGETVNCGHVALVSRGLSPKTDAPSAIPHSTHKQPVISTNTCFVGKTTRNFDMSAYSRQLTHAFAGLEFNYESMEEELTCPVCLELYADPLMLPCSHSVCKKCLQDILHSRTKHGGQSGLECPSCRKLVDVTKEKMETLPKNLALENIVFRYTEERSKSIRKSLSLESPISDLLLSPATDLTDLPEFPSESKTNCGLCESSSPDKAAWYCVQCDVAYCHACFGKYHPRRGALARHKIRPASEVEKKEKIVGCAEHTEEMASIFCDRCKVFVCHLCVCDGEGKHVGHKMLSPDSAYKILKGMAEQAREQSDGLLASVMEHKVKLESLVGEIKDLHKSACSRVELQYRHQLEDLTCALKQERDAVLQKLEEAKRRSLSQTRNHADESEKLSRQLEELSSSCQELTGGACMQETLSRASEVQPLTASVKKHKKEADTLTKRYESLLKDKSSRLQLQASVDQYRKRADKVLGIFLDDGVNGCDAIIPRIQCPSASSGSSADLQPRTQNKYLITWGFSSTSFTGEAVLQTSSWTVTIEKNSGHVGNFNTGYLFGVGISADILNVKDLVGMTYQSHGVICTGGALFFAHNGKQEHVVSLDNLPLSVTISVKVDHQDFTVFTYKLASNSEGHGISLIGRKIIKDPMLKKSLYPVFTVSQRVKLLFPTYV